MFSTTILWKLSIQQWNCVCRNHNGRGWAGSKDNRIFLDPSTGDGLMPVQLPLETAVVHFIYYYCQDTTCSPGLTPWLLEAKQLRGWGTTETSLCSSLEILWWRNVRKPTGLGLLQAHNAGHMPFDKEIIFLKQSISRRKGWNLFHSLPLPPIEVIYTAKRPP